ncbi:Indoleamine 2,3-dioxygenase [Gloeopeniophorella convolvens]|nr:Indoleamine 2,3-dioxygenase [Gloeopeniophorella convolvens]
MAPHDLATSPSSLPWAAHVSLPEGAIPAAADFSHIWKYGFHRRGPSPLVEHLPTPYNIWQDAFAQFGTASVGLRDTSPAAEKWRTSIREMPYVSAFPLIEKQDLNALLRACQALVYLLHAYVHSLPTEPSPASPARIPSSLARPLLAVSRALGVPPVIAYADTGSLNYTDDRGTFRILSCLSGTPDEAHFYRVSLEIEEAGAGALREVRALLDGVGAPAVRLAALAHHVRAMDAALAGVRTGCAPGVFYGAVRPWYVGCPARGAWMFELGGDGAALQSEWVGADGVAEPMAGSTAAQSALFHALDAFLGIEDLTHERPAGNFLTRMRSYFPLADRCFIDALTAEAQGFRKRIVSEEETEAYNDVLVALKAWRSTHIRIATLYVVNEARKVSADGKNGELGEVLGETGTGGTDLVPFLKGVRDRTGEGAMNKRTE